MRHVNEGILRRMVDEPLAVADSDRRHYETCSLCKGRLASITADAVWAGEMMTVTASHVDAATALGRVRHRIQTSGSERRRWRRVAAFSLRNRARTSLSGAALALGLVGALLWTPAGSLAQNVITVFQPTQIVAVGVKSSDLKTLQELSSYGTFTPPAAVTENTASSLDDAARRSGMTILQPGSLSAGAQSKPTYRIIPSRSASFTFRAAKAAAAAAAVEKTLPPMPAEIDGSTLQVTSGTAVIATYGGDQGGIPSVVVGQMKSPVIKATGVTAKQLETYLLGLPGISPELAAQIRAIGDPTTALPIPVLTDRTYAHPVDVQGVQGLAVGDSTGVGSGVVWQKDGIIYGVGGTATQDDIVHMANSMH